MTTQTGPEMTATQALVADGHDLSKSFTVRVMIITRQGKPKWYTARYRKSNGDLICRAGWLRRARRAFIGDRHAYTTFFLD